MARAKKEPSNIRIPEWRDAVAGAIAGAFSKSAMAPVERVKLLLQLQDSAKGIAGNTAWQVARNIYFQEGVFAFWRGNVPNVLRTAGQTALNLALMDYYKDVALSTMFEGFFLNQQSRITKEEADRRRKLVVSFVSGGLAGGTSTTVLYPIEYMRTRLAMDQGRSMEARQYQGMADVVMKTVRADGITGLYQGYGIALWGSVVYRLLLLGGYDVVKRELQLAKEMDSSKPTKSMNLTERFLLAQLVSLSAGTICYPIDSVRRRLMMQAGKSKKERLYRNSLHCFRQVWTREGIWGFYLGLGPNLVRSIGGALMLVAYDSLKESF